MHLSVPVFVLVTALTGSAGLPAAQLETDLRAQARRLLLKAGRLIEEVPEPQRSSALANIASQLTHCGDLEDALNISQLEKNPGQQDLATGLIAWNLVEQGNVEQALRLVESIPDERNREGQYGPMAAILLEKGDLAGALRIAQMNRNPQGHVSILIQIAQQKARSKNKDVAGASEVLKQAMKITEGLVKESAGSATLLPEIATTQWEIGDKARAVRTLGELSAIAHEYSGSEGNGFFLQLLGSAQARTGDIVGALQTYDEMAPGSNSDFVMMSIATEQAKQALMADALQSADRISDANLKSATLREVAIVRGTHGTLEDAIEAIHRIPNGASRSEAIGVLALQQAEADNPAATITAEKALEMASEPGAGPASLNKGWEMIAVTRAVLGDFGGAEEIIKGLPDPESRVWPLWNLTSMLAEAGREAEALALAEEENAPHPKLYALLGTAQGLLSRATSEERASAKK